MDSNHKQQTKFNKFLCPGEQRQVGRHWSLVCAETPGRGCILDCNFRGSFVLSKAEAVIMAVRTLHSGGQSPLSWQSLCEREFVGLRATKVEDILVG